MKKLVCVVLSMLLCSANILAAPISVSTVDSADETKNETVNVEKQEEKMESTVLAQETEPVKSIFVEFEKSEALGYTLSDVNEASYENGVLSFKSKKQDPRITFPVNFKPDDYEKIVVRMKWDGEARNDDASPVAQLFYIGYDKNGNTIEISEAYSIKVYTPLSSNGKYQLVTFPLNKTNMEGMTVTSMGLDPVNTNAGVSLDYLMIVPKNDRPNKEWHFKTDGVAGGWGTNAGNISVKNDHLTVTTTATDNVIYNTSLGAYKGSEYPKGYIRMIANDIPMDANVLLYTNLLDETGNEIKSWSKPCDGYTFVATTLPKSSNGSYKLHQYDFGSETAYMNNFISKFYLNINKSGVQANIDYVIFPHKNHFEWDFEAAGYLGEFKLTSSEKQILEDGHIKYTVSEGDTYQGTNLTLEGLSLDANRWAGIEVVMKNKVLEASKARIQVYYAGTTAGGVAFNLDETMAAKHYFTAEELETGDGSALYYLDLRNCLNWKGSTINKLRLDPVKTLSSYEIDYIRLVPMPEGVNVPLDENDMELKYDFEDSKQGTADGVITLDFGAQNSNSAESITLYWASKDENGAYQTLADYSAIKVVDGAALENGYKIDKNLVIPDDADALLARVKDCAKTFDVVFVIPENKKAPERGEPVFTVGLLSDIHVGGWGSEETPNERLLAARTQLSQLSDFVVANGDLTQWYGAYSGEEFKAYNYDGKTYADNGVTSTEFMGIGTSQWTVLTDYLKGFTVPVYTVQGNHDIKDSESWSDMLESEKHWRPFFENWVEYSNTAENNSKYENPVTLNDSVSYYDTEINGYHFIFTSIPKTTAPSYTFGEEQLKWLDMKLYEKEETGKPIFVFGHVPLNTPLSGSYFDDQVRDDESVKAVLAKHPTAIYVSGHTHYTLDVDYLSSIDGAQVTTSYIHDGGTTTINVPNNEANPDDTSEIQGSHGVVAKVYEDVILLCGRDFVNNRWISRGYTYLTLKEACEIEDVVVKKTFTADGFNLSANASENVSVTWIVDGAEQTEAGNSISVARDFEGSIAVRYTDAEGNYRSDAFENINEVAFGDVFNKEAAVSLRVSENDNTTGLRFVCSINEVNRNAVVEYGYIVTRKTFLDNYGAELTFDFKTENGAPLYVYGANYVKKSDGTTSVDKVFEALSDGVKFSGVITGIDMTNPLQVCETMVARCYAKVVVNGEEVVVYGKPMSSSLKVVAEYLRNNNESFYNANKEFIDSLADMTL